MAAQHIHGAHVLFQNLIGPACQLFAGLLFESVQNKTGKEKVVDHIAFFGDGAICPLFVAGVDFRQKGDTVRLGHIGDLLEKLPGAGVVEEVFGTYFFRRVGKSIQPDDLCAITGQGRQGLLVEVQHQRGFDVQVHLAKIMLFAVFIHVHLLIERVPIRLLRAVGKLHHQHRQARLAEEHIFNILLPGDQHTFFIQVAASSPKFIPVYEKVPVFRSLTLFQ